MRQQWSRICLLLGALIPGSSVLLAAADHIAVGCAAGAEPNPSCFLVESFIGGRTMSSRFSDDFADTPLLTLLSGRSHELPSTITPDAAPRERAHHAHAAPDARSVPALSDPPETETLRSLIANEPHALGSLSIGSPDGGALLGAVQLEDGPLWHVRDARDAWATTETVQYLQAAIEVVEKAHPGTPSLCVGDLSRQKGGPIDRHRSHQSGRDVDVGWYFLGAEAQGFRPASVPRLDLPRCWSLVRALVTDTDVERIFMDHTIQRALFSHALEAGEDRGWLERVFSSPGGRRDTIVQHERGHRNHMHVRFYNPRAQEWGRVAYPLLVEAGLAPPPVVQHRARRGDTLSTIARRYGARVSTIRAANGLSSTLIRAGRRYRIPVRRLASATTMAPLVVPPRLLPPAKVEQVSGGPGPTPDFCAFLGLP